MSERANKLRFSHDFDPETGHSIKLEIECRLGAAPTLIRQIVDSTIEPLAEKYDQHWVPRELPATPPDESD